MRMEHPEEKIDIVGRLRNFENAFVMLLVRPSESVPLTLGELAKVIRSVSSFTTR